MMFQALFLVLESTFHAQGTQLQNFKNKIKLHSTKFCFQWESFTTTHFLL